MNPDDGYVRYALGNAYGRAGEYERVLEHLDGAVAQLPDCGQCLYSRALTHARLGNAERRQADMEAACALKYEAACRALGTEVR